MIFKGFHFLWITKNATFLSCSIVYVALHGPVLYQVLSPLLHNFLSSKRERSYIWGRAEQGLGKEQQVIKGDEAIIHGFRVMSLKFERPTQAGLLSLTFGSVQHITGANLHFTSIHHFLSEIKRNLIKFAAADPKHRRFSKCHKMPHFPS